jgi:hypothetical protein
MVAVVHHHTGSRELFYVVSGAAQMLADESVMPADEGEPPVSCAVGITSGSANGASRPPPAGNQP